MPGDELSAEATIKISLGHLLMVWDVLSNKLSGPPLNDEFTEEEKRTIWALEDLCERALVKNGFTGRHPVEWQELVSRAREFIKTVPIDFLD